MNRLFWPAVLVLVIIITLLVDTVYAPVPTIPAAQAAGLSLNECMEPFAWAGHSDAVARAHCTKQVPNPRFNPRFKISPNDIAQWISRLRP